LTRRIDIDLVKGFVIVLVVFGHLVARGDPSGVYWYEPLRLAVYTFHMPVFLYLSGLVAVYSGMLFAPRAAWRGIIVSRVRRLLVPFFALGVLIVIGKTIAQYVVYVDNAPHGLPGGLASLFWNTEQSPAGSVWYLFVLFVVSLGSMMVLDGKKSRLVWLLGFFFIVYYLNLPSYVYLDRIGTYAVFFLIGAAAGATGDAWDAFLDRRWRGAMTLFLFCLTAIVAFHSYDENWPRRALLLPVGTLSLPAIHGWLRTQRELPSAVLLFLGRYSFVIYLLNTLFIGLAKGVMMHFTSWNGWHFLPFAAVMLLMGILGPAAVKRFVFRYVPPLDALTN
jgi:fucose 4-O-acetylase-like acetyltransferase